MMSNFASDDITVLTMFSPTKAARELYVFKKCVAVCGWLVDDGSIQNRPEPEPDILCRFHDGENRAFELVELVAEDEARRRGWQRSSQDLLTSLLENLPSVQRNAFEDRFRHALIYLVFRGFPGHTKMRNGLVDLFDELLARPETSDFELRSFQSKRLRETLSLAAISYGSFNGPVFVAQNIGGVGDPVTTSLTKKLAKNYATEYPIELVAYLDVAAMNPCQFWRGPLSRISPTITSLGPFQRIWVVDIRNKILEYVTPANLGTRGTSDANLPGRS